MPSAYLFVDRPVCALQALLDTVGPVYLMIDDALGKSLSFNQRPDGMMILVAGLNQNVFSGLFLGAVSEVKGISGVVTTTPEGLNAGGVITKISQVTGLRANQS